MYDLGLLSEAKKEMEEQWITPAARKGLKKYDPQEIIAAFLRAKGLKPLNYFGSSLIRGVRAVC